MRAQFPDTSTLIPREASPTVSFMAKGRHMRSTTLTGFGDSPELRRIDDDQPIGSWRHEPSETFPEIEIVREVGGPALFQGPWSAVAIWTQRRIYLLDVSYVCRGVLDRSSFMPVNDHPIIGATLAYGQMRDAEGAIVQLSRPLPDIGSQAIFSQSFGKSVRLSETSPVTRVVLRQHRVDIERQP